MAHPRLENGYLRIANELFEALIKYHCSGGEKDVILAVIRGTYGYNQRQSEMGLSRLAKMTGRNRKKVASDVINLIRKRVLLEIEKPFCHRARVIALNKDYEQWEPTRTQTVSESTDATVNENTDSSIKTTLKTIPILAVEVDVKKKERRVTAERIYEYYVQTIRAGAKADAIRNITKLLLSRKENELLGCVDSYVNSDRFPDNPTYRIFASNFFGRAERYKEFMESSTPSVEARRDTVQDDPEYQEFLRSNER
jgi:phage replication O-like protein O